MTIDLTLDPDVASGASVTDGVYEHNTQHAQQALESLIDFFGVDAPRTEAFLAALTAQVQELEDAFWTLLTAFDLDTATDDQLLLLGRLVGEPQLGRADEDFRAGIRARMLINRCDGKPEQLYEIARALVPSLGVRLVLTELPPLSGTFEFLDGNANTLVLEGYDLANIARLMKLAKAGGARLDVVFAYATTTPQTSLILGDSDVADVSGLGRDDIDTVGGLLSAVM